jgi:hypothetical protein
VAPSVYIQTPPTRPDRARPQLQAAADAWRNHASRKRPSQPQVYTPRGQNGGRRDFCTARRPNGPLLLHTLPVGRAHGAGRVHPGAPDNAGRGPATAPGRAHAWRNPRIPKTPLTTPGVHTSRPKRWPTRSLHRQAPERAGIATHPAGGTSSRRRSCTSRRPRPPRQGPAIAPGRADASRNQASRKRPRQPRASSPRRARYTPRGQNDGRRDLCTARRPNGPLLLHTPPVGRAHGAKRVHPGGPHRARRLLWTVRRARSKTRERQ